MAFPRAQDRVRHHRRRDGRRAADPRVRVPAHPGMAGLVAAEPDRGARDRPGQHRLFGGWERGGHASGDGRRFPLDRLRQRPPASEGGPAGRREFDPRAGPPLLVGFAASRSGRIRRRGYVGHGCPVMPEMLPTCIPRCVPREQRLLRQQGSLGQRFPSPELHRRALVHNQADQGGADHPDETPHKQNPRPDRHDYPLR